MKRKIEYTTLYSFSQDIGDDKESLTTEFLTRSQILDFLFEKYRDLKNTELMQPALVDILNNMILDGIVVPHRITIV